MKILKNKKFWIISCVVILFFSFAIYFIAEYITDDSILKPWVKHSIDAASEAKYGKPINWSAVEYYGTVHECDILLIKGSTLAIEEFSVAGFRFRYGSSFRITALKDGEFYPLKDAYELGLLTKPDIKEIYERHIELGPDWLKMPS